MNEGLFVQALVKIYTDELKAFLKSSFKLCEVLMTWLMPLYPVEASIPFDMNLSQTKCFLLPQKMVDLKPEMIVYTTQPVPEYINVRH